MVLFGLVFLYRGFFFSPGVHFSVPEDEVRGRKKNKGPKLDNGRKKILPKSRKKEAKICTTFRNEVLKTIYLVVVYNKRGFSTEKT